MINNNKTTGPNDSSLDNLSAIVVGNIPIAIFEPSKGNRGIRLNTAKIILKNTIQPTRSAINPSSPSKPTRRAGDCQGNNPIRIGIENTTAAIMLDTGPAAATTDIPALGPFLKYNGFTGTGLPHPKPTAKIITVPSGSKCLIGLRE
ncbi:uncharacterized protein METZ01_LOCUS258734, partial [marine metagenome]